MFIIKVDLRKVGWMYGLKCCCSGQAQLAGPCENSNETSGSEYTGNYWLAGKMLASQEGLCSKASVSNIDSQSVNQRESIR